MSHQGFSFAIVVGRSCRFRSDPGFVAHSQPVGATPHRGCAVVLTDLAAEIHGDHQVVCALGDVLGRPYRQLNLGCRARAQRWDAEPSDPDRIAAVLLDEMSDGVRRRRAAVAAVGDRNAELDRVSWCNEPRRQRVYGHFEPRPSRAEILPT